MVNLNNLATSLEVTATDLETIEPTVLEKINAKLLSSEQEKDRLNATIDNFKSKMSSQFDTVKNDLELLQKEKELLIQDKKQLESKCIQWEQQYAQHQDISKTDLASDDVIKENETFKLSLIHI